MGRQSLDGKKHPRNDIMRRIIVVLLLFLICSMCSGCKTIALFPVPEKKEEWVVVKEKGAILGVMRKTEADAKGLSGVEPLEE